MEDQQNDYCSNGLYTLHFPKKNSQSVESRYTVKLFMNISFRKKMKHVMIPFRSDKVFFRAFESALNIAKENNANLSLVQVINYPAGIGIDGLMVLDMASREYNMFHFDKILPRLQKDADSSKVKLDVHILDLQLSPAQAFVDFASKNNVELMVIGSIPKKGLAKHLREDISQSIMELDPPCNVILVE